MEEAAAAGARVVVLSGTKEVDAAGLAGQSGRLAADGVMVAVDLVWASDGTWADVAPALPDDLDGAAIIDSLATVPAEADSPPASQLREVLVEQLTVVEPLLGHLSGLTVAGGFR